MRSRVVTSQIQADRADRAPTRIESLLAARWRERVRDEREQDEQTDEEDCELEEPALDAAAAAVDGRVAAEGPREAGATGLQKDGGHEGDAHDDLADRQKRVHEFGTSCRMAAGW